MRNMIGETIADSLSDSPNMATLPGMRKPAVVEFMERAMAAILDKSGCSEKDLTDLRGETPKPNDNDSDNDSDGSEVFDPANSTEKSQLPTYDIIQSMRDTLMQGTNIAMLAGLLTTSTFSLKDKRIDNLIGADVPVKSREILMLELMKAIDALWERFGRLCIQQFGSFEKAFEVLDGDKSGFVDRDEFSNAYVDINLKSDPQLIGPAASLIPIGPASTVPSPSISVAESEESKSDSPNGGKIARATTVTASPDSGSRKSSISRGDKLSKRQRRSEFSALGSNRNNKLDIAYMNRTILKADAEFLFDMLRTGERGLANSEDSDEDLTVSMRTIIMRLTGLGEKTMESFRERLIGKYSSIQAAFDDATHTRNKKTTELDFEDFEKMFCGLYLVPEPDDQPRATAKRISKTLPAGGLPFGLTKSSRKNAQAIMPMDPGGLSKRAAQIFNGIDIDGSGLLTVGELQRALASFGLPTPFSTCRRRLLLRYGSYDAFFAQQPVGGWNSEEMIEAFAMELDLTTADAHCFATKLGLISSDDQDSKSADSRPTSSGPGELPADGYSIEEFAISVFLNKPEEATIEDLIAKLGNMDRDKDIPFREFTERIVNVAQQGMHFSLFQAVGAARAKELMMKNVKATQAAAKERGVAKGTPRGRSHSIAIAPVALPVTCRLSEVKCVYEALQREHRRVSVNILLRALTNFSDVLAVDRNTYQSGDHIICRVRLSTDAHKRCKELPFVAVVPERLEWKEQGAKSHWSLDGERVSDLEQVCDRVHEMPRAGNGSVLREACLKISVPFVLASEEIYEVRLFSSNDGRNALKQVGKSVPFNLLMPRPLPPLVDKISLNASSGEASAVLHWSPPIGNFAESPIMNFIVLVEPLIFRHERVAEVENGIGKDNEDEEDSSMSEDDEDPTGTGMKEVTVWSPTLKGFTKKLSYGIDGLQRGVQYRFGIQCVHAGPGQAGGAGRSEIRGAASELCDVVTMPLYNVTEAPGQPQISMRPDGMVELVWAAPADEGLSDSNRICNYLIQYRQCAEEYVPRHRHSHRGSSSQSVDDDIHSDLGSTLGDDSENSEDFSEDNEQGWEDIDEASVFISQPRWADFVGWLVPCHVEKLLPIGGELDPLPHEFRVCAANYAGNSAWSKPSVPIQLMTQEEKGGVLMPVVNLELVEVQGQGGLGEVCTQRSQCVLRWAAPQSNDLPRYTVQVRDATQVRGEGGWASVKTYFQRIESAVSLSGPSRSLVNAERRRSSSGSAHVIEAIVTGLERFPSFANLSLQVRATSQSGTSTAEVDCPGMYLDPPDPLTEAPQTIQVLVSAYSPPIVELQFPGPGRDGDAEAKVNYVVQASRALPPSDRKGESQTDQKWSEWETLNDVCFSSDSEFGGFITCFARDLGPEGSYIFRVSVVSADGRLSSPSPASDPPIEVTRKQVPHARRSTMLKSQAQEVDKEDLKPKKPRDVKIIRTERGWCEMTWEQRISSGGMMPTSFQVEESQDDHQDEAVEPVWVPARAVYASLEDSKRLDNGNSFQVKAAMFFADDRLRDGVVPSRWRVRVRAENSEWSAPTHWQEPPPPPLPPRPSAPRVLRNENQYFALEWKVPELDLAGGSVHYELQIQGHHQRHGGYTGKYSDWISVPVFTKPLLDPWESEPDEGKPHNCALQALVERRDIVESTRGSDAVCFRVRVVGAHGVTGQPSPGSDLVPMQINLPSAPVPKGLDVLGKGRIVMESQIGTMVDAECVRLQWFLPTPEEDPEGFNDASLPDLVYELEAKDAENGFWVPMSGALIELNHTTRNASALMALPPSMGQVQQTRIRIASSRGKGAPASYSAASQPILWGAPVELEDTPRIVQAEPGIFVVRYTLPQVAARPESCSVIALVEKKVKQHVRFQMEPEEIDDGSSANDDVGDEGSRRCSESGEEPLEEEERFAYVGEYAVYSQLSHSRVSAENPGEVDALQLQQSQLGFGCEGIIVFGINDRLAVGDEVRISVRIRMAGVVTTIGDWSRPSSQAMVTEPEGPPRAVVLLEYPTWTPLLQPGEEVDFPAKLMLGSRTKSAEALAWTDAAMKSADGKARFKFQVVNGALPDGFKLDPDTGLICGTGNKVQGLSSFTIRAEVNTTWPARNGILVEAGSATSVTLKTSLVDNSVHDILGALMQDSVVDELRGKDVSIPDVLNLLTDIKLLPACVRLHVTSEGDAGDSAIALVERVLQMPSDAIVVAAELEEEEFILRLFGHDALSDGSMSEGHGSEREADGSPRSGSSTRRSPDNDAEEGSEGDKGKDGIQRKSISSDDSSHFKENKRGSMVADLPTMAMMASGSSNFAAMGSSNVKRSESSCSSGPADSGGIRSRRHSIAAPPSFKAQSRRVSLAIQATDIKLNKLSELAQQMGLAPENLRKADSKAISRRASETSNVSSEAEDSDQEEEAIPRQEEKQAPLLNVGSASRAGSAASSSEGGSVSEEMAKQLKEMSQGSAAPPPRQHTSLRTSQLELGPGSADSTPLRGKKMSGALMSAQRSSFKNGPGTAGSSQGRTGTRQSQQSTSGNLGGGGEHQLCHSLPSSVAVVLSYPSLTPLWPAFTDVEFVPTTRCSSRILTSSQSTKRPDQSEAEEMTDLDPGLLRFEIHPPLPAAVALDEITGVISGSPLMEHVAGRQYTITARWEVSGQVAARCAVAFAVVSASLANLCNAAFLGQEPPAFRPPAPTSVVNPGTAAGLDLSTNAAEHAERTAEAHPVSPAPPDSPRAHAQERCNGEGSERDPQPHAEAVDVQSQLSSAIQDLSSLKMPPAVPFIAGMELQAISTPRKPGTTGSLGVPWNSKFTSKLPPTSASRKNVIPLGPPLRDREPLPAVVGPVPGDAQPSTAMLPTARAPLSARPRMRALYQAPRADGEDADLEWPSTAGSVRTALGLARHGGKFFGGSSGSSWYKPMGGNLEEIARTTGLTHSPITSARSRLTSSDLCHDLPSL